MVDNTTLAGIAVAGIAVGTVLVGSLLIKKAGGETGPEEPLPPQEQNTSFIEAGTFGSVITKVEEVQESAFDFFIFNVRFSNLANEQQTFDALMQIRDPNGVTQVVKIQKITVDARSSRVVRFSSGNLFKLATIRGVWQAEFFAWESIENPIVFSESAITEFIVDVL